MVGRFFNFKTIIKMKKNIITNKITPCCGLPFSVIYWWVSNLTLNSESDRQFILSKISQNGILSIDGWKVLINSGTLEADASLTKAEFLAWFSCEKQPSCEQLKLIIEGYKMGDWDGDLNEIRFENVLGVLKISDPAPTTVGLYRLSEIGTYTNLGGLVTTAGKINDAYFDGTTWSLIAVTMPKGEDGVVNVLNVFGNSKTDSLNQDFLSKELIKRPYSEKSTNDLIFSDEKGNVIFEINDGHIFVKNFNSKNISTSFLAGKKWTSCGDSYTDSTFFNSVTDIITEDGAFKGEKAYYDRIIANKTGINLIHKAVTGSYMTTNHLNGTQNLSFIDGIINRYDSIPLDSDIITIAYGLNEISQPLGNKTSTDTSTIWGAYNLVLGWIKTNIPTAKIGIIAMDGWMTEELALTLRDIATYWNCGFFNMYDFPQVCYIGRPLANVNQALISIQNAWADFGNSHPSSLAQYARSGMIKNFLENL